MKCKYRNCDGDLDAKRKGAKFCSDSCRASEHKLEQRAVKQLENNKKEVFEMLELFKMNSSNEEIAKLYDKIIRKK